MNLFNGKKRTTTQTAKDIALTDMEAQASAEDAGGGNTGQQGSGNPAPSSSAKTDLKYTNSFAMKMQEKMKEKRHSVTDVPPLVSGVNNSTLSSDMSNSVFEDRVPSPFAEKPQQSKNKSSPPPSPRQSRDIGGASALFTHLGGYARDHSSKHANNKNLQTDVTFSTVSPIVERAKKRVKMVKAVDTQTDFTTALAVQDVARMKQSVDDLQSALQETEKRMKTEYEKKVGEEVKNLHGWFRERLEYEKQGFNSKQDKLRNAYRQKIEDVRVEINYVYTSKFRALEENFRNEATLHDAIIAEFKKQLKYKDDMIEVMGQNVRRWELKYIGIKDQYEVEKRKLRARVRDLEDELHKIQVKRGRQALEEKKEKQKKEEAKKAEEEEKKTRKQRKLEEEKRLAAELKKKEEEIAKAAEEAAKAAKEAAMQAQSVNALLPLTYACPSCDEKVKVTDKGEVELLGERTKEKKRPKKESKGSTKESRAPSTSREASKEPTPSLTPKIFDPEVGASVPVRMESVADEKKPKKGKKKKGANKGGKTPKLQSPERSKGIVEEEEDVEKLKPTQKDMDKAFSAALGADEGKDETPKKGKKGAKGTKGTKGGKKAPAAPPPKEVKEESVQCDIIGGDNATGHSSIPSGAGSRDVSSGGNDLTAESPSASGAPSVGVAVPPPPVDPKEIQRRERVVEAREKALERKEKEDKERKEKEDKDRKDRERRERERRAREERERRAREEKEQKARDEKEKQEREEKEKLEQELAKLKDKLSSLPPELIQSQAPTPARSPARTPGRSPASTRPSSQERSREKPRPQELEIPETPVENQEEETPATAKVDADGENLPKKLPTKGKKGSKTSKKGSKGKSRMPATPAATPSTAKKKKAAPAPTPGSKKTATPKVNLKDEIKQLEAELDEIDDKMYGEDRERERLKAEEEKRKAKEEAEERKRLKAEEAARAKQEKEAAKAAKEAEKEAKKKAAKEAKEAAKAAKDDNKTEDQDDKPEEAKKSTSKKAKKGSKKKGGTKTALPSAPTTAVQSAGQELEVGDKDKDEEGDHFVNTLQEVSLDESASQDKPWSRPSTVRPSTTNVVKDDDNAKPPIEEPTGQDQQQSTGGAQDLPQKEAEPDRDSAPPTDARPNDGETEAEEQEEDEGSKEDIVDDAKSVKSGKSLSVASHDNESEKKESEAHVPSNEDEQSSTKEKPASPVEANLEGARETEKEAVGVDTTTLDEDVGNEGGTELVDEKAGEEESAKPLEGQDEQTPNVPESSGPPPELPEQREGPSTSEQLASKSAAETTSELVDTFADHVPNESEYEAATPERLHIASQSPTHSAELAEENAPEESAYQKDPDLDPSVASTLDSLHTREQLEDIERDIEQRATEQSNALKSEMNQMSMELQAKEYEMELLLEQAEQMKKRKEVELEERLRLESQLAEAREDDLKRRLTVEIAAKKEAELAEQFLYLQKIMVDKESRIRKEMESKESWMKAAQEDRERVLAEIMAAKESELKEQVKQKELDMETKEKELFARESLFKKEIENVRAALTKKEAILKKRMTTLNTLDDELKEKEAYIHEHEKELEAKEEVIRASEIQLESNTIMLNEKERQVSLIENEAREEMATIMAKEAEIKLKESELTHKEKEIDERRDEVKEQLRIEVQEEVQKEADDEVKERIRKEKLMLERALNRERAKLENEVMTERQELEMQVRAEYEVKAQLQREEEQAEIEKLRRQLENERNKLAQERDMIAARAKEELRIEMELAKQFEESERSSTAQASIRSPSEMKSSRPTTARIDETGPTPGPDSVVAESIVEGDQTNVQAVDEGSKPSSASAEATLPTTTGPVLSERQATVLNEAPVKAPRLSTQVTDQHPGSAPGRTLTMSEGEFGDFIEYRAAPYDSAPATPRGGAAHTIISEHEELQPLDHPEGAPSAAKPETTPGSPVEGKTINEGEDAAAPASAPTQGVPERSETPDYIPKRPPTAELERQIAEAQGSDEEEEVVKERPTTAELMREIEEERERAKTEGMVLAEGEVPPWEQAEIEVRERRAQLTGIPASVEKEAKERTEEEQIESIVGKKQSSDVEGVADVSLRPGTTPNKTDAPDSVESRGIASADGADAENKSILKRKLQGEPMSGSLDTGFNSENETSDIGSTAAIDDNVKRRFGERRSSEIVLDEDGNIVTTGVPMRAEDMIKQHEANAERSRISSGRSNAAAEIILKENQIVNLEIAVAERDANIEELQALGEYLREEITQKNQAVEDLQNYVKAMEERTEKREEEFRQILQRAEEKRKEEVRNLQKVFTSFQRDMQRQLDAKNQEMVQATSGLAEEVVHYEKEIAKNREEAKKQEELHHILSSRQGAAMAKLVEENQALQDFIKEELKLRNASMNGKWMKNPDDNSDPVWVVTRKMEDGLYSGVDYMGFSQVWKQYEDQFENNNSKLPEVKQAKPQRETQKPRFEFVKPPEAPPEDINVPEMSVTKVAQPPQAEKPSHSHRPQNRKTVPLPKVPTLNTARF